MLFHTVAVGIAYRRCNFIEKIVVQYHWNPNKLLNVDVAPFQQFVRIGAVAEKLWREPRNWPPLVAQLPFDHLTNVQFRDNIPA